jgi:ABC-2 type transport system permease protein
MPIYDQSYRRYEAREPLRKVRFWPITREALRLILSRRAFLGLLMIAWVPFLARVIQVYVVTRFPEAGRVLPVDGRLFGEFLGQQAVFTLFLTVFGGAGLIANDLRTGAILVYLSRPLTRRDYVLGKLVGMIAVTATIMLAGPLALTIARLALSDSVDQLVTMLPVLPKMLAVGVLGTLAFAAVPLGFSAIIGNPRHAMALWAIYYLVVGGMAYLLARLMKNGVGVMLDDLLAAGYALLLLAFAARFLP